MKHASPVHAATPSLFRNTALLLVFTSSLWFGTATSQETGATVFENVRVLPMTATRVLENQTVVIEGARIVRALGIDERHLRRVPALARFANRRSGAPHPKAGPRRRSPAAARRTPGR